MPWEQSARSAVSRAFRIVINCFTTQFYCQHRDIDASMLCVRRCAVCIARIYRFHFTPPCVCVSDLVIHYNYAFYGFRRLLFFVLLIFLFVSAALVSVSSSLRLFVHSFVVRWIDLSTMFNVHMRASNAFVGYHYMQYDNVFANANNQFVVPRKRVKSRRQTCQINTIDNVC